MFVEMQKDGSKPRLIIREPLDDNSRAVLDIEGLHGVAGPYRMEVSYQGRTVNRHPGISPILETMPTSLKMFIKDARLRFEKKALQEFRADPYAFWIKEWYPPVLTSVCVDSKVTLHFMSDTRLRPIILGEVRAIHICSD